MCLTKVPQYRLPYFVSPVITFPSHTERDLVFQPVPKGDIVIGCPEIEIFTSPENIYKLQA